MNDTKSQSESSRRLPPRVFLLLLVVSLPLLNPWVRGDGVGYYAFARALLFQHNLDFTADYQHANQGFREARLDSDGNPRDVFRTSTGHLDNHFTIGPAILWAPFLLLAHGGVLIARLSGANVSADGFSLPYLLAMAFGTLLCGFLALLISYRIACRFVAERWASLATIAIWWGSSLPVYMYFNTSWSHAHSAFAVALFFWYWLRTREFRSRSEWFILALIAGLAVNVYYPNLLLLMVLIPEALAAYYAAWRKTTDAPGLARLLTNHILFCAVVLIALLPTFLTKYVIYGRPFESGYIPVTQWSWSSPWFVALLFSANHGLLSWTPILFFAVAGILLFVRAHRQIGISVLCVMIVFYYFMASYPDWPGISSYGNRFFISLTVFFVLGLASFLEWLDTFFRGRVVALATLTGTVCVFILWNLGLIFQWGAHLIPARGAVSWRQVAHNQFQVVPRQALSELDAYLFRRKNTLHQLEQRDMEELARPAKP